MLDIALYKYSVKIHSVMLSCVTVCLVWYVVSLRYVNDVNKDGIIITVIIVIIHY